MAEKEQGPADDLRGFLLQEQRHDEKTRGCQAWYNGDPSQQQLAALCTGVATGDEKRGQARECSSAVEHRCEAPSVAGSSPAIPTKAAWSDNHG